jgi:hypothetical protein
VSPEPRTAACPPGSHSRPADRPPPAHPRSSRPRLHGPHPLLVTHLRRAQRELIGLEGCQRSMAGEGESLISLPDARQSSRLSEYHERDPPCSAPLKAFEATRRACGSASRLK